MDEISSIRDLIDRWPTRAVLAEDMTAVLAESAARVTMEQVHKWAQKNSIPARFHRALLLAAAARGIAVTADDLVRLHGLGVRAVA